MFLGTAKRAIYNDELHSHFVTLSCYRRRRLLDPDRTKRVVLGVLDSQLAAHGTVWLPSPPRQPWYNGDCEAGNGSMRTRTDHFTERADGWTGPCLEAARRQANELTRPEGHLGPTPSQRWAARTPISPAQRQVFRAAVVGHQRQVIAERQDNFDPENKNHQHQVRRHKTMDSLVRCLSVSLMLVGQVCADLVLRSVSRRRREGRVHRGRP